MKEGYPCRLHMTAREQYERVLTTSFLAPREFHYQMVLLIDSCKTYMPPYLEILETLEGQGRMEEYDEFLAITRNQINQIFQNPDKFFREIESWTFLELFSFYKILKRITDSFRGLEWIRNIKLVYLEERIRKTVFTKTPGPAGTHLLQIKTDVDIGGVASEMQQKKYLRYGINPKTYHHYHEQFVILRAPQNDIFDTRPASSYINLSPPDAPSMKLIKRLQDFAEDHDARLGFVRLFSLRPNRMVYRHCDELQAYGEGSRYHLVLSSKNTNIITVGTDCATMKEGELWSYNNKVEHKAYNESSEERMHIVFDTHPRE